MDVERTVTTLCVFAVDVMQSNWYPSNQNIVDQIPSIEIALHAHRERERQREMLEAWDNMWTDCVLHLLLLLPAAAALLDSLSHGGKKKKRREKGRSHHMVDEAGTTGPSTLFNFFFFFILSRYCCYEFPKERRKKKREKILMWDNPHVSHESPATCVVVVVAIDRPTTATHHLKNVAHSEHDKRRHRLSGNAVVHDCQQTSTFTFFLLLLLLLLQYKKNDTTCV